MNKKEPKVVNSVAVCVSESTELQRAVAMEILYTENEECLEEILKKGEKIGPGTNSTDNHQCG